MKHGLHRTSKKHLELVGYARVSTDEQEYGLDAQEKTIRGYVRNKPRLELMEFTAETASGRDIDRRPGLQHAINLCVTGEADGIIVSRLDRLTRSMRDFSQLIIDAEAQGWELVILDPFVDTTSAYGKAFASVAAVFAQLEADLVSQRTREGMAAARARGVHLGPPVRTPACIEQRIVDEAAAGRTPTQIADGLTLDGVPTPKGHMVWRRQTVSATLDRLSREFA